MVQDPVQGFGTQHTVMMKRWQILSVVYRAYIQCDIILWPKRKFLLRPAIHCCIGSYKTGVDASTHSIRSIEFRVTFRNEEKRLVS